eukprot:TRINITY_DN21878_c0_g1_i1.p1 TRINITY_DN21878_c0_g1~~TRINITY_DN21878_c0_g1_i1.p1  ORF type:complete len:694 (+),score=167.19 TRINITY_DN21878_c0_g1_i1:80-2161(+)
MYTNGASTSGGTLTPSDKKINRLSSFGKKMASNIVQTNHNKGPGGPALAKSNSKSDLMSEMGNDNHNPTPIKRSVGPNVGGSKPTERKPIPSFNNNAPSSNNPPEDSSHDGSGGSPNGSSPSMNDDPLDRAMELGIAPPQFMEAPPPPPEPEPPAIQFTSYQTLRGNTVNLPPAPAPPENLVKGRSASRADVFNFQLGGLHPFGPGGDRPGLPTREGRGISRAVALDADNGDYIFSVPDSDSNLIFISEKDDGETPQNPGEPKRIKAGTLAKLVERLTYPNYTDQDYLKAFLLTYRSFMTPQDLMRFLMVRYYMPIPKTTQAAEADFIKNVQTPIRLRVSNVFKGWIRDYSYDFEEDPELVTHFEEFLRDELASGGQLKILGNIGSYQSKHGESKVRRHVFNKTAPKPIFPVVSGKLSLWDIHPEEIARQLTLQEYDLYRKIKPWECLGQAWSKENKEKQSPNILAMIKRFNDVSNWVVAEIVTAEDEITRVSVMNRFIEVARRCARVYNNFNACMEIIAGLTNSSIYRLKREWDILPPKTNETFQGLRELLSREHNFVNFRAHLHTCNPPCIPYLGVYLTDLTFIEDGTSDKIGELINFDKRRKVAAVVLEIQRYQQTPYNLEVVDTVMDYLNNLKNLSDDEAYQKSLAIIPRGATGKLAPKELKELQKVAKNKIKQLQKDEAAKYPSYEID